MLKYKRAAMLMERHAEVDFTCSNGNNPLFAAARDGHAECVRLLLGASE